MNDKDKLHRKFGVIPKLSGCPFCGHPVVISFHPTTHGIHLTNGHYLQIKHTCMEEEDYPSSPFFLNLRTENFSADGETVHEYTLKLIEKWNTRVQKKV